jgi:hypothetical protein
MLSLADRDLVSLENMLSSADRDLLSTRLTVPETVGWPIGGKVPAIHSTGSRDSVNDPRANTVEE